MKNRILEALKLKFEGVDAKILNRIADKMAKTVTTEEGVQPAVDGVTFASVLESYGDSRATEASASAVSNYEKKHGLREGKPAETSAAAAAASSTGGDPTSAAAATGAGDTPEWVKQIIESQKALKSELEAIKGEKTTMTRKQTLEAAIKDLPEPLKKPYLRTNISALSDEEFTAQMAEIETEVSGLIADNTARQSVFTPPFGRQASAATNEKTATSEEAAKVAEMLNI